MSDGRTLITAEEYRALVEKLARRTKYGNTPTAYNGVVYHSALEAACAAELDRLMAIDPPLVWAWGRQVSYLLGRRRRVSLVVDFVVLLPDVAGPTLVEAKGYRTAVYRVKRAWFDDSFGLPIHEVRSPAEIEPLLRGLGGG